MTCLIVGCNTSQPGIIPGGSLSQAQRFLEAGELYQAKKIATALLKENPSYPEAQQLMAAILDQEIAQHKEAFEAKAPEEVTDDEKSHEVKTWLERSKGLLEAGEYDQASLAAEHIFQYDPKNREASRLLDQIKKQAWIEGKREISSGQELVHDEVDDRLAIYRRQARQWFSEGKPGAARLAVEKILLLSPEDEEALKLLESIKSQNSKEGVTGKP